MDADELSRCAVEQDLASPRYRVGAASGRWRMVSGAFPIYVFAVAALRADGGASEYFFRFELSGFPATAPEVNILDPVTNTRLPLAQRPNGSPRVVAAFKEWGEQTVYRPWERKAGAHGDWRTAHPTLAWRSERDLAFILEDLHGLLTSSALASAARA